MNATGLPIGTFKNNDAHPTIKGLVFRGYGKRRSGAIGEDWMTLDAMEKRKSTKAKYTLNPKVKAIRNKKAAEYRAKNPEKHREAVRKSNAKNKGKRAAYNKEYRARNRDYFAESEGNRRAKIKDSDISNSEVDRSLIRQVYTCSKRLSECTGFAWHVDHITPISIGGTHTTNNLQVVPQRWNQVKKNTNSDKIQTL